MTVELPLVGSGRGGRYPWLRRGGAPLAGVGLELLDVTGRVTRETRTEYDGFFLFEAVPYGEYQLRIAKLSAQAIDASPILPVKPVVDEDNQVARLGAIAVSFDSVLAESVIGEPSRKSPPSM